MEKKVCPYCDQPIGGNYCKGCRRIVWKPVKTEITYYLNERHPQSEHNCQYHGDLITGDAAEAKKAEIRERMAARPNSANREGTAAHPKKNTIEKNIGKKNASGTKKGPSALKTIIIMYIVLIFGSSFIRIAGSLIGSIGDTVSVIAKPEPETVFIAESEEMDEWERSDDEVKAAGESCTAFGHFPVVFEDAESVFVENLESFGFQAEMDTYSYNQVMDHFTWYETTYEYVMSADGQYAGILDVDTDTATGEIHSFSMYTHEEDGFFKMVDMVLNFMEDAGITEELPDARTFYEEALTGDAQKEDGYKLQYGVEVSCYETDPDEEDPFYKIEIYAPGYYSDINE